MDCFLLETMQIAILNYSYGTVDLYTIPDVDDIEGYMKSKMDYNISDCLFMCGDNIEICDERTD
mgnify:CR=1 FL=1